MFGSRRNFTHCVQRHRGAEGGTCTCEVIDDVWCNLHGLRVTRDEGEAELR